MKYNNGWPILDTPKNILEKSLAPSQDTNLLGYLYKHPFASRIPITIDSFKNSKGIIQPSVNGHTKSVLTEVFAHNNMVWANIPSGLAKKLGFTEEDLRSVALSWTDAISQALDLKSMPLRTQGIHNKGLKPSSGWHQDAPHSGRRFVSVLYQPKQAKWGHFEFTEPTAPEQIKLSTENMIYRIPNNTNSYTIASFRDDLLIHRGQKRLPLNEDTPIVHNFESFQRFE
jgi:hypothetical protein